MSEEKVFWSVKVPTFFSACSQITTPSGSRRRRGAGTGYDGGCAWHAIGSTGEVGHLAVDYVIGVITAVGEEDILVRVMRLLMGPARAEGRRRTATARADTVVD